MGGGPDIVMPQQPNYSEALADSLKAQVDLLRGTGEFKDTGGLGTLVREYEAPLRQETAQIDTDVLRQTLLGGQQKVVQDPETGKFGIPGAEAVKSNDGEPQTAGGGRYQVIVKQSGRDYVPQGSLRSKGVGRTPAVEGMSPTYTILDTETGGTTGSFNHQINSAIDAEGASSRALEGALRQLNLLQNTIDTSGTSAVAKEFNFTNPNTGEPLQEGEVVRAEDGMVDLLGDSRNVQEFTTRQATAEDVTAGLASEVGESITEASGDRQAGFSDKGQFLGLSALAEDIQRGNLSRQREADLADVERLSDRYRNVMDEYKPAATSGLEGARELLAEQKDAMTTGGGAITVPTGGTFGGQMTPATMTAAEVADPLQLQASTQFQGELGTGSQDTIRSALLGQARKGLNEGLTDRERRSIEQASRARQTATGRIFDPSATVQEAQAVIEGDRNRQMQNRAFAQSVMGQEAGLQQGDITRGMAQESEQAGLQQRRDLAQAQMDQQAAAFGADAAQRSGLANQAQQQQASQFDTSARMEAEGQNERLRQQGLANYINAVGNLARMEDQYMLDPFQALLGRGGGTALQQGQGLLGQANYGLQSGPQFLNPEAGLSYISNIYGNQANIAAAQAAGQGSAMGGLFGGLGSLGGGLLTAGLVPGGFMRA